MKPLVAVNTLQAPVVVNVKPFVAVNVKPLVAAHFSDMIECIQ